MMNLTKIYLMQGYYSYYRHTIYLYLFFHSLIHQAIFDFGFILNSL